MLNNVSSCIGVLFLKSSMGSQLQVLASELYPTRQTLADVTTATAQVAHAGAQLFPGCLVSRHEVTRGLQSHSLISYQCIQTCRHKVAHTKHILNA